MDRTTAVPAILPKTIGARRASTSFRRLAIALAGAVLTGNFASPAVAASETSTRLVRCGAESCLLITGHREDAASIVSINGQAVLVEGKRSWRVSIPVDTVRQWSAPYAREIEVSLRNPETQRETVASADLPIGMLGTLTDLAALEVSVH